MADAATVSPLQSMSAFSPARWIWRIKRERSAVFVIMRAELPVSVGLLAVGYCVHFLTRHQQHHTVALNLFFHQRMVGLRILTAPHRVTIYHRAQATIVEIRGQGPAQAFSAARCPVFLSAPFDRPVATSIFWRLRLASNLRRKTSFDLRTAHRLAGISSPIQIGAASP